MGGRTLTAAGDGISNVRVTIMSGDGRIATTITSSFGYYAFDNITAGDTYLVSVSHKRYEFAEPVRVVVVFDAISDLNFNALP